MIASVSPAEVRLAFLLRREIALIDLREEDPFAKAHPLFAACLPLSRLELEVFDRIPRRDTPIVLYDNGEGLVAPAADRLHRLGYSHLRALEGGLDGWRRAGFELFQDVNSYCKAFGELVDSRRGTPSVAAQDLQALIDAKADIVVLDARRFDEFQTMNIPTGVSVPGAELVLRAPQLAPDPNTTIIGQLRRPHPQHYRRPVPDQRRPAQSHRRPSQWRDRVDPGRPGLGARPKPQVPH